jgi:hypothetical protein
MVSTAKTARFNLTALTEGTMPGLSSVYGAQLAQAAAVCLENREHRSGVTFHLVGVKTTQFLMEWPPVDDQARRSHNDLQEATERGAYGVAILIVCGLTGMVVVERSAKGLALTTGLATRTTMSCLPERRASRCRASSRARAPRHRRASGRRGSR